MAGEDKKRCKWMRDFLKYWDGFGTQMQFKINKDDAHGTEFGGLFFLVYGAVFLGYTIYNFIDFVTYQNVNLLYSSKVQESTPNIDLIHHEYAFSIGLVNEGGEVIDTDIAFFDFSIERVHDIGKPEPEIVKIPTKKCVPTDFTNLVEKDFAFNDLNRTLCPDYSSDRDLNYNLTGLFTDPEAQYLRLRCMLNSSFAELSSELLTQLMASPIRAILFYMDKAVDHENIEQPVSHFLNSVDAYIDIKSYKRWDMFMAELIFSSDQNVFVEKPDIKNYVTVDQSKYNSLGLDIAARQIPNHPFGMTLVEYNFKATNRVIQYERSYMKLPEFMADMGGIIAEFAIIVVFIVTAVNDRHTTQKVANKIMKYKYKKNYSDKDIAELLPKKRMQQTEFNDNANDINKDGYDKVKQEENMISNPNKDIQIEMASPEEKYKDNKIKDINAVPNSERKPIKAAETKVEDKPLSMSSWGIAYALVCCCMSPKKKWQLKNIEKVDEKLEFYMDILNYIKKMHDIDVMKYIMMNDDQLRLFNFLSQPSVIIGESESVGYKMFENYQKSNFEFSKEQLTLLFKSYENIVNKPQLTLTEKKLVALFDTEFENIRVDHADAADLEEINLKIDNIIS
jgi:hypothetical protein